MRKTIWDRLANEWRPRHLETIVNNEVDLDKLGESFGPLMEGNSLGRTLVSLA